MEFSIRSEDDSGNVWYYSTPTQLKHILKTLDSNEMETNLARELQENKEEIVRQMEITEKLTNQYKGNKRSYIEVENGKC